MVDTRVEASALVEKTPTEQLPALGAMVLKAWCARRGTSRESVAEFVALMTQIEGHDEMSAVLSAMLGDYAAAANSAERDLH